MDFAPERSVPNGPPTRQAPHLLSLRRRLRDPTDLPDLLGLGRPCKAMDPGSKILALLELIAGTASED